MDASLSRVTVRTLSQLRSLVLKFRKRYAPLLQSSIYISSSFDCVRSQRPEIIRFSEKRLASLVKLPRLVPHAHSRSCLVMLCMLCAVWELNTAAALQQRLIISEEDNENITHGATKSQTIHQSRGQQKAACTSTVAFCFMGRAR